MIELQKCWCGNTDLDAYSEDYLKCAACETLVARQMPQPDIARVTDDENDFYGREYWFSRQEKDLGYVNITLRAQVDLPERCLYWLRTLLKYKLPPGDVLELGCSHGGFTAMLRMAGFEATGLEISPWVVDYARNTFGVPVLLGPVEDQQIEPCSLDVIAMMDVLEHFPDPVTTLSHCLKLLRPDGVMVLQTPRYPEFVTYDRLVEENVPFIELLKEKGHLYLFSETSVCRLLAQLGFEHIRFEPAIFAHYDMFLLAGRAPLKAGNCESIQNMLCANPNGRIVQALLDLEHQRQDFQKRCEEFRNQCLQLSEQNAALTDLLHESEADRAARLDQIQQLTELLRESDKDRAARFKQTQQLTKLLHESEADRSARVEQTEELSKRLSESDKDREARQDQILKLTELLKESEADRAARLDNIQILDRRLGESDKDREVRFEQIQQLTRLLEESEADRAARLETMRELEERLTQSEADRAAKAEYIDRLGGELAGVKELAEERQKQSESLSSELAALQSSVKKMQATRTYRLLRKMGYRDC